MISQKSGCRDVAVSHVHVCQILASVLHLAKFRRPLLVDQFKNVAFGLRNVSRIDVDLCQTV